MLIRLDNEIVETLDQGIKLTPHDRLKLIRLTLRRHLGSVIQEEAKGPGRITNVNPLPKGVLAKAYKRLAKVDKDWDRVEASATAAQAKPWEDE